MYHILLIEDDFAFANLVRKILALHDFHVTFAPNGIAGIQAVQRLRPQLVLLDDSLPDLDSFLVARRLSDLSYMRTIPIIGMTDNPTKAVVQHALQSGCRDVIAKPIDILDFPRQVANYLESDAVATL